MVEPARDYFDMRELTPTPKQSMQTSTYEIGRNEPGDFLAASPIEPTSQVLNAPSCQAIDASDLRPFTHFIDHTAMDGVQKQAPSFPSSPPDQVIDETTGRARPDARSGQTSYPSFPNTPQNAGQLPRPSDNIHGIMASPRQPSPHSYYGQGVEFNSPVYTVPIQSAPHTPPFAAYPPTLHNPESRVTPQNHHFRYQPILQPHVVYYPHQPPPSQHISNQFQPIHYPPLPPPQFQYPPQHFPSPQPVYQPYPSHQPYVSTESEAQGAWYYLPHGGVQQRMEENPVVYPQHYPSSYPPPGPPGGNTLKSAPLAPQNSTAHPRSGLQSPARNFGSSSHSRASPQRQPTGVPSLSQVNAELAEGGFRVITASPQEKPISRKSYHPNPAPFRSEWVMWVGNIPSDATNDELSKFFGQLAAEASSDNTVLLSLDRGEAEDSGVVSIFLISKSSCAFVNYRGEEYLTRAIERFNGKPLRPYDSRSLRLVCRVRKRDDDLKAGVGGQRGQGLHVRWVKDKKSREQQAQSKTSPLGESSYSQASRSNTLDGIDNLAAETSRLTLADSVEGQRDIQPRHRSSSGSFASTDSSLLSTFFPKRYFILKSLTQYDLDISVQQGLWATQKHNEGILDRAYRTSNEVYLIFGVNKSGEFYGYARMTGAVEHGERIVPWASRSKDAVQGLRTSRQSSQLATIVATPQLTRTPLDIHTPRTGEASAPGALSPTYSVSPQHGSTSGGSGTSAVGLGYNSAPGQVQHYRQLSITSPITKAMTMPTAEFELDPQAPIRAMRNEASPIEELSASPPPFTLKEEQQAEDDIGADTGSQDEPETTWGDCFKVEWLCTERLPFYWTRNLRNPWNHDREVKISRDGTELEPSIGESLLNAWQVMRSEGGQIPPTHSGPSNSTRKGGYTRRTNAEGKPTTGHPPRPRS